MVGGRWQMEGRKEKPHIPSTTFYLLTMEQENDT